MTSGNVEKVLKASSLKDIFGVDKPKKILVNRLLRKIHPDLNPDCVDEATEATIKLRELFEGKSSTTDSRSYSSFEIRGKKMTYILTNMISVSDGMRCYETNVHGTFVGLSDPEPWIVENLKKVFEVSRKLDPFFPHMEELIEINQNGVGKSVAVVFSLPRGEFSTFAQVLKENSDGLDQRDIAWMLRRVLSAVDTLHENGLAVGSLDMDSFLVDMDQHGVVLKDLQFVTKIGEKVSAVSSQVSEDFGDDLWKVKTASAKADIQMIGKTLEKMLSVKSDMWIRRYMLFLELGGTKNALGTLIDFDSELDLNWGKRTFHRFTGVKPKSSFIV